MTKLDAPMDSGGNDAKKAGPKEQAWSGDTTLKTGYADIFLETVLMAGSHHWRWRCALVGRERLVSNSKNVSD